MLVSIPWLCEIDISHEYSHNNMDIDRYLPQSIIMVVKQPPMTGNGKHTTYINGDWGMVYYCFTHI
jgi:hypothetical protein